MRSSIGVNVALGIASVEQCPAIDVNGDGEVTIDELISAVGQALQGCEVRADGFTDTVRFLDDHWRLPQTRPGRSRGV